MVARIHPFISVFVAIFEFLWVYERPCAMVDIHEFHQYLGGGTTGFDEVERKDRVMGSEDRCHICIDN